VGNWWAGNSQRFLLSANVAAILSTSSLTELSSETSSPDRIVISLSESLSPLFLSSELSEDYELPELESSSLLEESSTLLSSLWLVCSFLSSVGSEASETVLTFSFTFYRSSTIFSCKTYFLNLFLRDFKADWLSVESFFPCAPLFSPSSILARSWLIDSGQPSFSKYCLLFLISFCKLSNSFYNDLKSVLFNAFLIFDATLLKISSFFCFSETTFQFVIS